MMQRVLSTFRLRKRSICAAVAAAILLAVDCRAAPFPDEVYMPAAPENKASNLQPWKPAPREWGKMLEFYTRNNIFPGASILVKSPKWGVRFISTGRPVLENPDSKFKPTTQFRIGSCTKATVAVAILQLDYEHKLNLDDPITRHLPKEITDIIPNAADITIRQCLQMTAGLRSYTDIPYLSDTTPENALDVYTPLQLLSLAMEYNSYVFRPGESVDGEIYHYDYSNTGYLIAGLIAEQIEKKPLYQILDERVFKKAGMTDTFLARDYKITRRMANGYTAFYETGEWQNCSIFDQSVPWAAGAVISTPFDQLHFYETLFETEELLPDISRRKWLQMNYPGDHKGYGSAVLEEITPYGTMLGHGGTVLGYLTLILYNPDRDFYYISYINTWDNKYTRAEIFLRIAYLAMGSPEAPVPADGESIKLKDGTGRLAWHNGFVSGEEYRVYIGNSENAVFNATIDKHPDVSLDRVAGLSLLKKDLIPGKRYYWRVDVHRKLTEREIEFEREDIEVLISNFNTYVYREVPESVTIPGPVWSFVAK